MSNDKGLDKDYKLIPLAEITEEARKIAVRWGKAMANDWIGEKHKLASDIMNYARRYSAEQLLEKDKEIERLRKGIVDDVLPHMEALLPTHVQAMHKRIKELEDGIKLVIRLGYDSEILKQLQP